jgi:predicted Zn-dependent protease
MQDWSKLRFLVVEDSATMRMWLRNSIVGMGGKSVDQAINYSDALYRINNREPFDVILCDYILDDGERRSSGKPKDGQHLLEECRHRRLIPTSCVFIMVTAERAYEQIFAVAELAPDDYLIKPLTPSILSERLSKAYEKKQVLKPLTDHFDLRDYTACMDGARAMLAGKTPYALDCLRLIGECLLKLNRNEEAHQHYNNVLIDYPRLPWARLGAARTYFALDRYDESRDLLESLIIENGDFTQAHDLLAHVHEVKGSPELSRALIKEVLARNPRAIHRHREVVRMALDVGDVEDATSAYAGMFEHGVGSVTLQAGDFSGFSTLLLKNPGPESTARLTKLISTLNDHYLKLDSDSEESRSYRLAELVAQYARAKSNGNAGEADNFYAQINNSMRDRPISDNGMQMAVMEIAITAGDEGRAAEIARKVLADYHGNEAMTARIIGAMEKGGMGAIAKRLTDESEVAMQNLNRKAVGLAREGKVQEAMYEFIRLADETRNLSVTFNAALAIVRALEAGTDDEVLARKLAHYIDVMKNRDAGNPRTAQMLQMAEPHLRKARAAAA